MDVDKPSSYVGHFKSCESASPLTELQKGPKHRGEIVQHFTNLKVISFCCSHLAGLPSSCRNLPQKSTPAHH